MKIEQRLWKSSHQSERGWNLVSTTLASPSNATLVLAFGSRDNLSNPERFEELRAFYPEATIVMGTTAGEILDLEVLDDTIVATAVHLERTPIRHCEVVLTDHGESEEAGRRLVAGLDPEGLKHIFVISDGQIVNGSALVTGMTSSAPKGVQVTGGLAGDAARFERTLVGLNGPPTEGRVVAIGFYGDSIRVGCGSMGGWDSFGQDRVITKAEGNVLFELDNRNALDLYKEYLGEKAAELPSAALLFPLSVKNNGYDPIVRTILSIDENAKSMTFAGDMPVGAKARLMKANFDRLVDGAYRAAESSVEPLLSADPELAILISCVGRKLVLDERIEEEVEAVREVIGTDAVICGFYSYGEISPLVANARCELHNQTMTITTLREVVS